LSILLFFLYFGWLYLWLLFLSEGHDLSLSLSRFLCRLILNWSKFLILVFFEVDLLLWDLSICQSLFVVNLFSFINEESVLEFLLCLLHWSASFNSILILIIGVGKVIFWWFLDLLLLFWVWWLRHTSTSVFFSPLDRLISPGDRFLIVLEDLGLLSSEDFFELLLGGKVLHFHWWCTEGSVNWIRLNKPNSSIWSHLMNNWKLNHVVLGNVSYLGHSLTIWWELEFGVSI
jgi:hypothetical protein